VESRPADRLAFRSLAHGRTNGPISQPKNQYAVPPLNSHHEISGASQDIVGQCHAVECNRPAGGWSRARETLRHCGQSFRDGSRYVTAR